MGSTRQVKDQVAAIAATPVMERGVRGTSGRFNPRCERSVGLIEDLARLVGEAT
jgi:hypothetical protein